MRILFKGTAEYKKDFTKALDIRYVNKLRTLLGNGYAIGGEVEFYNQTWDVLQEF